MELFSIGSFVEIQISSKEFVSSFARQDHLHSHRFDLSRKKIHRSRSSNGRYVISFQMINNILKSVDSFFDCVSKLVMDSPKECGNFFGRFQIRSVGKSNGERMKSWPPSG